MFSTFFRYCSSVRTVEWYVKNDVPITQELYKTTMPFMQLKAARRILDVDAGVGEGLELMLPQTDEQTSFVLTSKLENFNSVIEQKNFPRTETIVATTPAYAYPGEYFDRIFHLSTLQRVENVTSFFREAYRLLVPNGLLAFSLNGMRNLGSRMELLENVKDRLGISEHEHPQASNPGKLKNMLKNIGFQRVTSLEEYYLYPTTDMNELATIIMEDPAVKNFSQDGNQETVKEVVESELARILKQEETILNYESLLIIAKK